MKFQHLGLVGIALAVTLGRPLPVAGKVATIEPVLMHEETSLYLNENERALQHAIIIDTGKWPYRAEEYPKTVLHVVMEVPTLISQKSERPLFRFGQASVSISAGTVEYFYMKDDKGVEITEASRASRSLSWVLDIQFLGRPPKTLTMLLQAANAEGIRDGDEIVGHRARISGLPDAAYTGYPARLRVYCGDELKVSQLTGGAEIAAGGHYLLQGANEYKLVFGSKDPGKVASNGVGSIRQDR